MRDMSAVPSADKTRCRRSSLIVETLRVQFPSDQFGLLQNIPLPSLCLDISNYGLMFRMESVSPS
jgi:hypothetical protein